MNEHQLTLIANLSNEPNVRIEILTWSKQIFEIQQFNDLDRHNKLFQFLDSENKYITLHWVDIASYRQV